MSAHDYDKRNETEWSRIGDMVLTAMLNHGERVKRTPEQSTRLGTMAADALMASLRKRWAVTPREAPGRVARTAREFLREAAQNLAAGSARWCERQLLAAERRLGIESPEQTQRRLRPNGSPLNPLNLGAVTGGIFGGRR